MILVGAMQTSEAGHEAHPRNPHFEAEAKRFLKGKTCIGCGTAEHLQCHHKFPFHLYAQLEMDQRYWRPLCMGAERCHLQLGHHGNWTLFNLNVDEEAAQHLAAKKVSA